MVCSPAAYAPASGSNGARASSLSAEAAQHSASTSSGAKTHAAVADLHRHVAVAEMIRARARAASASSQRASITLVGGDARDTACRRRRAGSRRRAARVPRSRKEADVSSRRELVRKPASSAAARTAAPARHRRKRLPRRAREASQRHEFDSHRAQSEQEVALRHRQHLAGSHVSSSPSATTA